MITLYQLPVSPFCITIEAILRYAKAEYRLVNLLYSDRRMIVEKTKGAYCKIPLLVGRRRFEQMKLPMTAKRGIGNGIMTTP